MFIACCSVYCVLFAGKVELGNVSLPFQAMTFGPGLTCEGCGKICKLLATDSHMYLELTVFSGCLI